MSNISLHTSGINQPSEASRFSIKSVARFAGKVITEGIVGLSLAARLAIPMGAMHLACADETITYGRDAQTDVGKLDAGRPKDEGTDAGMPIQRTVYVKQMSPTSFNIFLWENETATQLTFGDFNDSHPTWCVIDNNFSIVFASNREAVNPGETKLFRVDISFSPFSVPEPTALTPGPNDKHPQCSKLRTVFFICNSGDICSIKLGEADITTVYTGGPFAYPSPTADEDGNGEEDKLFFSSGPPFRIISVSLLSGQGVLPIILPLGSGDQDAPSRSPIAPLLTFTTTGGGGIRIATANSNDGSGFLFLPSSDGSNIPRFSSDGLIITFHSNVNGPVTVWSSPADGSTKPTELIPDSNTFEPEMHVSH